MDNDMSTNIDDIPDPVLMEVNDKPSPNLKQQDDNISNIKMNIEKNNSNKEVLKSDKNLFNEINILLIFILLLAGLPQSNHVIMSIIPIKFQNEIVINIVKAFTLFLIYYIVSNYFMN